MAVSHQFKPAVVYDAYNAPGKPLVVLGASTDKHPEGLSVNMYFSKKGRLKGVTVWDGDTEEFVAVIGQIPPGEAE